MRKARSQPLIARLCNSGKYLRAAAHAEAVFSTFPEPTGISSQSEVNQLFEGGGIPAVQNPFHDVWLKEERNYGRAGSPKRVNQSTSRGVRRPGTKRGGSFLARANFVR